MAETVKKVEVRYGAFACRVEGFDDPVEPLRAVLSLMQRVIAETPALADQRPALDDAQFARIGEALSEGRVDEGAPPGVIVIRSGERGEAIEDAEILADADRREARDEDAATRSRAGAPPADAPFPLDARPTDEPTASPRSAEAGLHPSAAVYAAPAAAAAEAAFAAGIAALADPADEIDEQGPLGAERPDDPVTPAALFAAPAAGVAEASFQDHAAARPADPDDDAGDPDLPSADESAAERVQPAGAEQALGEDAGAISARMEPSDAEPSGAAAREAEAHDPSGERAEPEPWPEPGGPERAEPDRSGDARSVGGPGDGWSPWDTDPRSMEAPSLAPASGPEAWPGSAARTTGAAPAPAFRERAPDYDGAEDEALPAINIFAPPPPDAPPALRSQAESPAESSAAPSTPRAPLHPAPDLAADDAEIVPDAPAGEAPERRTALPGEDADEVLDARDWPDEVDDPDAADETGAEAAPDGSAENRLAALITRYQSGLHGHAARAAEPDVAGGSLSAAELAERAEATEVEDLLAVSAAWLTLLDGRERFTRREVMEVYETLPGEHARTLEARIKGFGGLVRSGTLQLMGEGAFSLAPSARARFRALIDQG